MEDPTTIALNLTFFGTLGVAFFMFLGLFLLAVSLNEYIDPRSRLRRMGA